MIRCLPKRSEHLFGGIIAALVLAASTHAAIIVNSGFGGPEVLDLGDVTRNPITADPMGTWLLGGHDGNSDDWDINGVGATAVAANDDGGEAQGLVQWVQDNKTTRGPAKLGFDYRMQTGTGGDYDLHLYAFGWNAGDNAPGVDYENGSADTGDSFIPDDSVSLITDPTGTEGRLVLANNGSPVFSGVVNNGIFQHISVNTHFGSGYDFVGVLFYGENGASDGILELDNVQFVPIPEAASSTLVLVGLSGLMARRRRAA